MCYTVIPHLFLNNSNREHGDSVAFRCQWQSVKVTDLSLAFPPSCSSRELQEPPIFRRLLDAMKVRMAKYPKTPHQRRFQQVMLANDPDQHTAARGYNHAWQQGALRGAPSRRAETCCADRKAPPTSRLLSVLCMSRTRRTQRAQQKLLLLRMFSLPGKSPHHSLHTNFKRAVHSFHPPPSYHRLIR